MADRHKNQRGYTRLDIIFTSVVVILLCGAILIVYYNYHKAPVVTSNATVVWKTYCDQYSVGCVKYPSNWRIVKEDTPGTSKAAFVQFLTPVSSTNPVDVNYNLAVQGSGSVSSNQNINEYSLNEPISGDQVDEGIISSASAPYIVLVNSSGSEDFTTNNNTWSLMAAPESEYASKAQAKAWFASTEAKDALKIIESFTYQ